MKLSVKVEYACRVLAQLGRHYGASGLSHIEDLAQIEKIPSNYLAQILTELRHGGVIVSRRGKQGGYALARKPEEITLYDIVKIIDGELLVFNTEEEGHSGKGVVHVWMEVRAFLEAKTKEYTIEDFIVKEGEGMYYI
ncbi:MAG: Rrf2 family transcriptional regulator [Opitutales bacterium]